MSCLAAFAASALLDLTMVFRHFEAETESFALGTPRGNVYDASNYCIYVNLDNCQEIRTLRAADSNGKCEVLKVSCVNHEETGGPAAFANWEGITGGA